MNTTVRNLINDLNMKVRKRRMGLREGVSRLTLQVLCIGTYLIIPLSHMNNKLLFKCVWLILL